MAGAMADRDGDTLRVEGDLDFDSVTALWDATGSLFANGPPNRIDLMGVSRSSSAGVALMVAWLGLAQRNQRQVVFVNIPAQMQAIIAVADLDTVLPVI